MITLDLTELWKLWLEKVFYLCVFVLPNLAISRFY